jgi:uncharacterized NAD(P)/FAD-binding protein YdhS
MSLVHSKPYDIAIVGSGIACSMTLLEFSKLLMGAPSGSRELRIAVIEKEGEFWNGIPYGKRSSINSLAIQKLGDLATEPGKTAFIEWLETNKRHWLKLLEKEGGLAAATWIRNNRASIESGKWDEVYVPRFLYGLHISESVASSLDKLKEKGLAKVTPVQAEAIDLVPSDALYTITLEGAGGAQSFLKAERVVLAVGSPPLKPVLPPSQPAHHACINDIYSPSEEVNLKRIYEALSAIEEKSKRNILILGSNASSLEALYLINYRPEIKSLVNSIVVVSRSGLLPYKICEETISFEFKELELLKQKSSVSALDMITAIKTDVQRAEEAALNIADLFHPIGAVVGQLFPRLEGSELEQFFCQHGMTFTKLMRRAGRDCREGADELAADGMLAMVKGEFCRLGPSSAGDAFFSATYAKAEGVPGITHPLPFGAVLNCGGFEELSLSSSRLIASVVRNKVCKVNSTNRGFLVNDRLEANRNLYVNGPLVGGNFNNKIRFWHVESAPRVSGLSKILAKSLFDSLSNSSVNSQAPVPAASLVVPQKLTGYVHPLFVQAFSEFGEPTSLPRSGGWIIKRPIAGFDRWDGMGCYPMFSCLDWTQLSADLDDIASELVSLSVVIDPFGNHDEALIKKAFPDVVLPFKEHYVTDLTRPPESYISSRHMRNVKKAGKKIAVEACANPRQHLEDWLRLYAVLIQRHSITGLRTFSRQSFQKMLEVPGLVMFRATLNGEAVGILLWYVKGEVAYYHLGSFSELGYEERAAFALFWSAINHFRGLGLKWLHLGGREGAQKSEEETAGLSSFKGGWSTGARPAYFCGRIFNHEWYEKITRARNMPPTTYFPAYRSGEFI